ncbi:hypothetical protein [Lactococcus ileimucosae]|uniref:hypothetical protein n=1 Tax=Lactococcus ileimucosae TaxID=2941329 RepID=UPI0020437AD1|nr:hypothetical protein [Lactococcus ileimucosae]
MEMSETTYKIADLPLILLILAAIATIIVSIIQAKYRDKYSRIPFLVLGVLGAPLPFAIAAFSGAVRIAYGTYLGEKSSAFGLFIFSLFPMIYGLVLGIVITFIVAKSISKQYTTVSKQNIETVFVETGLMGVGMVFVLLGSIGFIAFGMTGYQYFLFGTPKGPWHLLGFSPIVLGFIMIAKWYKIVGKLTLQLTRVKIRE